MNRDGNYPLHFAAKSGNDRVINKLVAAGADLNCQNLHLDTPLITAVKHNQKKAVEELIKHFADVNLANTVSDI